MFESVESRKRVLPARYMLHWMTAVPLCLLVGAMPDQILYGHRNKIIGDFLSVQPSCRLAQFVFVPGFLLFADVLFESSRSWAFRQTTAARIQFIMVNALGIKPGCEGDCFDAIGAIVLVPSLAYSVGAFIAIRGEKGTQVAPHNR